MTPLPKRKNPNRLKTMFYVVLERNIDNDMMIGLSSIGAGIILGMMLLAMA